MKKRHVAFAFAVLALGGPLHFLYEWTGENSFAALFFPVNESVWEHLKLLAVPFIIFAFVEYFLPGGKRRGFFAAKALSLWAGITAITALYYLYSGIAGAHFLIADIALFVIGAISAYALDYKLLSAGAFSSKTADCLGLAVLLLTFACFAAFTFFPPEIPLFKDPAAGAYGVR